MFKVKLNRRNITNDELVHDIKKVSEHLCKTSITSLEYDEYGSFGKTTILRRFKSWNKALASCGLEIKNRQNIPEEEFFENIAEVWKHIGRQPVSADFSKTHGISKISIGAYEKRFGSWNKALLLFIEYIDKSFIDNKKPADDIDEKNKPTSRTSRKINWRIRAKILIRDNCICNMCGASPAKNPEVDLHVDHIIPWTKGGETIIENLQTLCSICNIGKSDILIRHSA